MNRGKIESLLRDLGNPDGNVRERATEELWRLWFRQKGELGLQLLRRSQSLLEAGEVGEAEDLLTEAIAAYPDFAEAWNRRAVLYFTQKDYEKSRRDCQQVVQLNPYHFGAWHGLGLCHASLGNYSQAIGAFRQALEIQPYSLIDRKLILECTALLT